MRFVSRAGVVMTSMWAVALGLLLTDAPSVEARPEYKKGFDTKYKEFFDKANTKTACELCHAKGDKKKRNVYGEDYGKTLGEAKVKDMKKIEEALGKIEDKESPTKDKKYIDLIKEGKYPAGNDPS
jgi:hypothetical protein